METFVTISAMKENLTRARIVGVCRELLHRQRRVGVRDVMRHLQMQYGIKGRTQRVAAILKEEEHAALPSPALSVPEANVAALLERVRIAEERAAQAELRAVRAEELERKHQDFWAARYAQRAEELEHRYAELARRPTSGVSSDQYLKVCQLNAELTRRLELYEWEHSQQRDRG